MITASFCCRPITDGSTRCPYKNRVLFVSKLHSTECNDVHSSPNPLSTNTYSASPFLGQWHRSEPLFCLTGNNHNPISLFLIPTPLLSPPYSCPLKYPPLSGRTSPSGYVRGCRWWAFEPSHFSILSARLFILVVMVYEVRLFERA